MTSPRRALERACSLALVAALLAATAETSGCALLPTLGGRPPALEPPPGPPARPGKPWLDLRGIVHCHTELSHDSEGPIEAVVEAANDTGVAFIAMTDHFTPQGVNQGLRGEQGGVIFFAGAELNRGKGAVLALAIPDAGTPTAGAYPVYGFPPSAREAMAGIRAAGGLAFVGHAEGFQAWSEVEEVMDGLEIVNLHAEAKDDPWWSLLLSGLFETPPRFFRRLIDRPAGVLARWDAIGRRRRVPAVGGCDAHANVRLFGPLGGTIGTYAECFRTVTTHVLVPTATSAAILDGLREGRAYVAIETHGDATGFTFALHDARAPVDAPPVVEMGGETPLRPGLILRCRSPGADRARVALFRDGVEVASDDGGALDAAVVAAGVHRIEVTLDGRPFVFSNAIYVR